MTDPACGPQLPTAADVRVAADYAAMFTWMPGAVPAAGTRAALDRLAQTERAHRTAIERGLPPCRCHAARPEQETAT